MHSLLTATVFVSSLAVGDGNVTATKMSPLTLRGHTDEVSAVTFSPDGKRLASCSKDSTVRVWETRTGKEVKCRLETPCWPATRVAYSRDGRLLAACGGLAGGGFGWVRIWDAGTGRVVATSRRYDWFMSSLAFSPDSNHLAAGVDKGVRVLDVASGKETPAGKEQGAFVYEVAYSPDGKWLAVGAGDYLPIGGSLPEGGNPGGVRVWDVSTGKESLVLRGFGGVVPRMAFSPDGRLLASTHGDKTIKVWDFSGFLKQGTRK